MDPRSALTGGLRFGVQGLAVTWRSHAGPLLLGGSTRAAARRIRTAHAAEQPRACARQVDQPAAAQLGERQSVGLVHPTNDGAGSTIDLVSELVDFGVFGEDGLDGQEAPINGRNLKMPVNMNLCRECESRY